MESELGHEAAATSTGFRICVSKTINARPSSLRTFIARIQSAFSSVEMVLHSLRTTGFVQVGLGLVLMYKEDTACTDQRKARATERRL